MLKVYFYLIGMVEIWFVFLSMMPSPNSTIIIDNDKIIYYVYNDNVP